MRTRNDCIKCVIIKSILSKLVLSVNFFKQKVKVGCSLRYYLRQRLSGEEQNSIDRVEWGFNDGFTDVSPPLLLFGIVVYIYILLIHLHGWAFYYGPNSLTRNCILHMHITVNFATQKHLSQLFVNFQGRRLLIESLHFRHFLPSGNKVFTKKKKKVACFCLLFVVHEWLTDKLFGKIGFSNSSSWVQKILH